MRKTCLLTEKLLQAPTSWLRPLVIDPSPDPIHLYPTPQSLLFGLLVTFSEGLLSAESLLPGPGASPSWFISLLLPGYPRGLNMPFSKVRRELHKGGGPDYSVSHSPETMLIKHPVLY